jgi:hypothetical protein
MEPEVDAGPVLAQAVRMAGRILSILLAKKREGFLWPPGVAPQEMADG